MKKTYFIPRSEAGRLPWLQNFANKLGNYATKYGLTKNEVDDMVAAALVYAFWCNYINQYNEYLRKLTQYRNELRLGVDDGATASVIPTPPTMSAPPTAVEPGIFRRAASIAGVIKSRSNYTVADGMDLGIEGSDQPAPDLVNAKPSIGVRPVQGGKPEVLWAKGDYDGVDIYVDRGTGWIFLATDTYPNYIDNSPLPATGQAAAWRYKAIYRYGDDQVGLWSDVVSIAVGG